MAAAAEPLKAKLARAVETRRPDHLKLVPPPPPEQAISKPTSLFAGDWQNVTKPSHIIDPVYKPTQHQIDLALISALLNNPYDFDLSSQQAIRNMIPPEWRNTENPKDMKEVAHALRQSGKYHTHNSNSLEKTTDALYQSGGLHYHF